MSIKNVIQSLQLRNRIKSAQQCLYFQCPLSWYSSFYLWSLQSVAVGTILMLFSTSYSVFRVDVFRGFSTKIPYEFHVSPRNSHLRSIVDVTNSMEQSSSSGADIWWSRQEIPRFYGTWSFITVFTRPCHQSLFWARWIQCTHSQPIALRSILISSFHPHRGLDFYFNVLFCLSVRIRCRCPFVLIDTILIKKRWCQVEHIRTSATSFVPFLLSIFTDCRRYTLPTHVR
jgi:hypothetical protein